MARCKHDVHEGDCWKCYPNNTNPRIEDKNEATPQSFEEIARDIVNGHYDQQIDLVIAIRDALQDAYLKGEEAMLVSTPL